ncbi:Cytochrome c-type biogenesis protein CcmE [bioreactor metagenome]|uniref:Cytochrome c-type biogenesis protein CcmE n=1 Tax=bioreactor metagenome TaxID=1076179 RepID=A0A644U7Y4_9ZZZZ|nr:cytochrome c maturation protein CcmE [Desulfitobacterium hafniense]MEA5024584.1 cytochrome c maturation protein CcmE [Desulfitobacterium hafniense]
MNKKTKMIIAISIVLLAVAFLFVQGFKASGGVGEYLTIEEALSVAQDKRDKFIQMEATVVSSTVKYDSSKPLLTFDLTDEKTVIRVTYADVKPDNFDSGYPVIVEGRFDEKKQFKADKVLVKCPSKYEEESKS